MPLFIWKYTADTTASAVSPATLLNFSAIQNRQSVGCVYGVGTVTIYLKAETEPNLALVPTLTNIVFVSKTPCQ